MDRLTARALRICVPPWRGSIREAAGIHAPPVAWIPAAPDRESARAQRQARQMRRTGPTCTTNPVSRGPGARADLVCKRHTMIGEIFSHIEAVG
jgi:hypothetical protein